MGHILAADPKQTPNQGAYVHQVNLELINVSMLWRNISWIERTIGHEQNTSRMAISRSHCQWPRCARLRRRRRERRGRQRKTEEDRGRRRRRLLGVTIAPLARSPLINRGRFPLVICRFLPLKRQGGVLQFGKTGWRLPARYPTRTPARPPYRFQQPGNQFSRTGWQTKREAPISAANGRGW